MRPSSFGAALYETGLSGVADRLLKLLARQADVAADALGAPPGMRALDAQAMKLRDKCGGAFEAGLGNHRPMVPQWHAVCQY